MATAEAPALRGRPAPDPLLPGPPTEPEREPRERPRGPRVLVAALLVLILVAGLGIRFRHLGYGLPFVYSYDEAQHFTSRAVAMLGGSLDPGYYENPSGFTYLVYAGMRLWFGTLGPHLRFGGIPAQFAIDPTPIWLFARGLAAVLSMAGVAAMFLAARRFWGARVALVAAALLAFAFLPVTYSRIALTDAVTFLPVAAGIWAILRVREDGRRAHYLAAGAAIGLAVGFKYTAGLMLVPLLIAAATRRDLRGLALALGALAACFAATTPYFFVHPAAAISQLAQQAQAVGETAKLGQSQEGGFLYYLDSLTWGFGWAPLAAAAAGAVIELRRDRMGGILLVSFPLALFLFMGVQSRYFGRWLLMAYPVLALLAGIGVVHVAGALTGRRRAAAAGALAALLTAALLIQPVAAAVRSSNVLGRTDTQTLARDWLIRHYPHSLRVVIEPAVPDTYYRVIGNPRLTYNHFLPGFADDLHRRAILRSPAGADTTYAGTLAPTDIDAYRARGFCLVMTNSLIRGRVENAGLPAALAYYRRLERESTRVFRASPFRRGATPVPLHYDFSYDYYPAAYARPGGIVDIYRLDGCRQRTGVVPSHPYGNRGLEKGIATSLPSG